MIPSMSYGLELNYESKRKFITAIFKTPTTPGTIFKVKRPKNVDDEVNSIKKVIESAKKGNVGLIKVIYIENYKYLNNTYVDMNPDILDGVKIRLSRVI